MRPPGSRVAISPSIVALISAIGRELGTLNSMSAMEPGHPSTGPSGPYCYTVRMKSRQYWRQIAPYKEQLREAIPNGELRELHRRRPAVHLLYAARQFAIVAGCGLALWRLENPLFWIPL